MFMIKKTLKKPLPGRFRSFRKKIWDHYRAHGRRFPWRETRDPYAILVSEIMLQQTQTQRVLEKFPRFLEAFPTVRALAGAELADVLRLWQGLGYNRRALALKKAAQALVTQHGGEVTSSHGALTALPGVGEYTASAIEAFAFNKPSVFIETNLRTVFIHFFFRGRAAVRDSEIMPLIAASVDVSRPREWYYALMDYGAMLKKRYPEMNKRSAHYCRQSPLEGSERQIRGLILKAVTQRGSLKERELIAAVGRDPERVKKNLARLVQEGFLKKKGGSVSIV